MRQYLSLGTPLSNGIRVTSREATEPPWIRLIVCRAGKEYEAKLTVEEAHQLRSMLNDAILAVNADSSAGNA